MAYSFIILSFISPFSSYYYGLLWGWYHFTTAATVANLLLSQSQYHGIRTDRFDLVKKNMPLPVLLTWEKTMLAET